MTLTATDGGLSTGSTSFNVTGLATTLKFTTQPQASASGSQFLVQPVIGIYDSTGLLVTGETSSLTQAPVATAVTPGAATPLLTQCTGYSPTGGYISLNSCAFAGTVGDQYTMTVTLGSVTSSPSADFSPSGPGTPSQLSIVTDPVGGPSGSQFATQPVILVEDSGGNLTTVSGVIVTLTTNGGSNLSGCANLSSVGGVVTVANCVFSGVVGTQYTLTANSQGLASDTSNPFTPSGPGAPYQVVETSAPSSPVTAGTALSSVAFSIEDNYGNLVSSGPGSSDIVSVSLASNAGSVTLQPGPTASITAVGGVARLSGEAIDVTGTYAINAQDTSESLLTATAGPVSVVAAAPSQLSFTTQPGGGNATVAVGRSARADSQRQVRQRCLVRRFDSESDDTVRSFQWKRARLFIK